MSAKKNSKKIYFTITGMNHFHGQAFLKPGMKIRLEKEPDNPFDKEAILVSVEGLGPIAHVANSAHTVKGDSYSAGRMYDCFKKRAVGKVKLVLDYGAICVLKL